MQGLISKYLAPYEAIIWAVVAFMVLIGAMIFIHHERDIGRQDVIAADAKARADEHKKVAAETARLQKVADDAQKESYATRKILDDYAAAHPVGSVRLCNPKGNQPTGVPGKTGSGPGTGTASAGPPTVPTVLGGGAGESADIGPEIDAILSAAETVGRLNQQRQRSN